jgi:hypothetical protein
VDDVRLDAFGGLVENQDRWLQYQGAPDGELLLLAAGQIAAAPLKHRFQNWKQVEDARKAIVAGTMAASRGSTSKPCMI